MTEAPPDLSFEDWLVHVFDHEVRQPQWYFGPDAPYWQGAPPVAVAYLTRFFEDPAPSARAYSEEQLNQGFWYLVGSGGSDHMLALLDQDVPMAVRLRCNVLSSWYPGLSSLPNGGRTTWTARRPSPRSRSSSSG